MARRAAVLAEQKEKAIKAKINQWANRDIKLLGFISDMTKYQATYRLGLDADWSPADNASEEITEHYSMKL